MIFGIGCDIVQVSRMEKWVQSEEAINKAEKNSLKENSSKESSFIERFFNEKERLSPDASFKRKCESYAGKFAAKEAFSKALGTGISGFALKEVFVVPDSRGKPEFKVTGEAAKVVKDFCGDNYRIHVSISHEKEYAVACAVIETGNG